MSRPRIRTIKPDIWADERVGALSAGARLLFVGLITLADDEGRLRALQAAIVGHVFPYEPHATTMIDGWLEELTAGGLVTRYQVDGRPYMMLPGFRRHQVINRPSPSELPPPPDGNPGAIPYRSVSGTGALTPGRERKGKEGSPLTPETSSGESGTPPDAARQGSPRQRGSNPRARGANPRAAGAREARAVELARARAAAAALRAHPARGRDPARWQLLREQLRQAVPEITWDLHLSQLELVGADEDGTLVLDAPDQARAMLRTPPLIRLLDEWSHRVHVPARLTHQHEHIGLTLEPVPA